MEADKMNMTLDEIIKLQKKNGGGGGNVRKNKLPVKGAARIGRQVRDNNKNINVSTMNLVNKLVKNAIKTQTNQALIKRAANVQARRSMENIQQRQARNSTRIIGRMRGAGGVNRLTRQRSTRNKLGVRLQRLINKRRANTDDVGNIDHLPRNVSFRSAASLRNGRVKKFPTRSFKQDRSRVIIINPQNNRRNFGQRNFRMNSRNAGIPMNPDAERMRSAFGIQNMGREMREDSVPTNSFLDRLSDSGGRYNARRNFRF